MFVENLKLITGATGFLGSHIAEQLVNRQERVRALVRPSSDTRFLEKLNVEILSGDLNEPDSIRQALKSVDTVYHAAAFVGDWGPWRQFYSGTVETTRNLVEACRRSACPRILHVSSISVYGKQPAIRGEYSEDLPTGQNHWIGDHYGRTKFLAEEQLKGYSNYTIVRPSWVYGPRDYKALPRVFEALRAGRVRVIGSGVNPLNMVYATDVARGAILAANHPSVHAQAFHLCHHGECTQRDMIDILCDRLKLPPVRRNVSLSLAWCVASIAEMVYQLARRPHPPPVTRRALYMVGRPTQFSTARAARQLGWQPEVGIRDGLKITLDWYAENNAAALESRAT